MLWSVVILKSIALNPKPFLSSLVQFTKNNKGAAITVAIPSTEHLKIGKTDRNLDCGS